MEGLQRFWILSEIERLVEAAVDVTGARKLMQLLQFHVSGNAFAFAAASWDSFFAFHMESLFAMSAVNRMFVSPDGSLWCLLEGSLAGISCRLIGGYYCCDGFIARISLSRGKG